MAIGISLAIPFKKPFPWSYWATHLYGQDDLNFWVKEGTRNGLILPDSINPGVNDAGILLPYLYKPTGNEYAYVDDATKLDILTSDFTLCGWVKSESSDKSVMRILMGKYANWDGFYAIGQDAATGFLHWYLVSSTGDFLNIATNIDFTTLGWAFLKLDINQTTHKARFFVNEVQIGADQSFTGTFLASGYKFGIGNRCSLGTYISKTSHSDTYIYPKVLTPTEGTILMARGFVAGATAHWTFNERIYDNTNLFYDVTGNGNNLKIVNVTSSKRNFGIEGSRYLLDKGYSLYRDSYDNDLYVGYSYAGTPLLGSTIVQNTTYLKKKDYSGNLTNHNLADSLIEFAGINWDRSDATIFNNAARGGFYDASNPKRWHPSELNQQTLESWFMPLYRDIDFVKVSNNSILFNNRDYFQEFFSYNTVKTSGNLNKILQYTNDYSIIFNSIEIFTLQFSPNVQVSIALIVSVGKTVLITWGDGNTDTIIGDGTQQTKTSNYTSVGIYFIKLSGDIDGITKFYIPSTPTSYKIQGRGDIFYSLKNLLILELSGGRWLGHTDNLPSGLTHLDFTGNSFWVYSGNWDNLPSSLIHFCSLLANGNWIGNFNSMNNPNVDYISFADMPNIIGNIELVVAPIKTLTVGNSTSTATNNNIIGDIGNLPAGIEFFLVAKAILITGHLEDLPSSLGRIEIYTTPNITYNGGNLPAWVFASDSGIKIDNSWNTAMIDAFLINAATRFPSTINNNPIKLDYLSNGARSPASDVAVATLTGKGYVVTTN